MKKMQHSSAALSRPHDPPESEVEILEAEEQEGQDMEMADDYEGVGPAIAMEDAEEDAPLAGKSLPIPANVHDNLHLYLREVSRFPLLKPDEEQRLARRVREHNDSEAAFQLISSHLRLVVKIAMDFQRRWMQNVLDLIQEGNVGLMRAVNKFDPDRG
ncbi:MAG: RNA polymerase subunit sigma-70, partial [Deltaproteobacteria bacterium]|nr:RNA polymerase subunit sigma-70 [Deltaproteobacteria bacterium]